MNKSELNAQIDALELALDEAGVKYAKVDRKKTNSELEQELDRLESLLPNDDATGEDGKDASSQVSSDAPQAAVVSKTDVSLNAAKTTGVMAKPDLKWVQLHKGINVEMTLSNSKKVLIGGKAYQIPARRARDLVAENLGAYFDPDKKPEADE